jgi:hypothetical protein
VQQLLELGANVHLRNKYDQTPFQIVSQRTGRILIRASQSVKGITKSEVEPQREKHEIEQLLLKHGAESE